MRKYRKESAVRRRKRRVRNNKKESVVQYGKKCLQLRTQCIFNTENSEDGHERRTEIYQEGKKIIIQREKGETK